MGGSEFNVDGDEGAREVVGDYYALAVDAA